MPTISGRNVKVEVATAFASSINPSAVTKADPPSVTLTSHGLADGDVGYWTITSGMTQLNEQACVINQVDTDTFTLLGLDSTNWDTFVQSGSLFFEATTWATISEAASYTVGGGDANPLDDPRLLDNKLRQVAGFNSPENLTIDVSSQEVDGAAMAYVINKARNGANVLIKITKVSSGQILRVCYGVPSVPGESVRAGQLGTGSFNVIVPGYVVKPNA